MYYYLIGIPVAIYFLYKLYCIFFIDILDFEASILATIFLSFGNKRNRIMEFNLKKVFPEINSQEINEIKYKSLKLSFLNLLICLHQRFLITRDLLLPKCVTVEGKLQKNEKCIMACAHYGIVWHPVTFKKQYGSLAFLYKNNFRFLDSYFLPRLLFNKHNVYPFYHNQMSLFKREKRASKKIIICDQKGNSQPVKFLNNLNLRIFNSPAVLHNNLNLPIYVYFCKYEFKTKTFLQKIIKVSIEKNDDIDSITQKIANIFTEEINKNPEQYFWLHDIFKIKKKI